MKNLDFIKEKINSVFYLKDDMVVDVVLAVILGTRMQGDPIWLMIVGPSGGGKSELVNIASKVDFAHQISELTPNTLLSGVRRGDGEETSLLHRIGVNGLMLMKDFTSILSMRDDKRDIIMGQLREVYDGHITKATGNGVNPEWRGKLNFLGGVTDAIHFKSEKSASMGPRMIFYNLPEQNFEDRIKMMEYQDKNHNDINEKRNEISEMVAQYVNETLENVPEELPVVPENFSKELKYLANFVAMARTPVERNYKDEITNKSSHESPTRMYAMFYKLSQFFMWMSDTGNELSEKHRNLIKKIAIDSIPHNKRDTLDVLAAYDFVTAKGLAHLIRFPTSTTRKWLEELNTLQIIERQSDGVNDNWILREDFRELILSNKPNIKRISGGLLPEDVHDDDDFENNHGITHKSYRSMTYGSDDPGYQKEINQRLDEQWDEWN